MTQYSDMWTAGLKEILTKGAAFTEAAYPYATPGPAPGTPPSARACCPPCMAWWTTPGTTSPRTSSSPAPKTIRRGPCRSAGYMAKRRTARGYLVPNFADELKRQLNGRPRVVSLSLKARSAIGLGGHGGANSTIVWKEDGATTFATSSGLTTKPSPAVHAFCGRIDLAEAIRDLGTGKAGSELQIADQAPGEPAARGMFPHFSTSPSGCPTLPYRSSTPGTARRWPTSTWARMAEHLVAQEQLGQRQTTDFLAISFSTLDIVGHDYGPRSHEVQDVLLRLDATIGRLLAVLDAKVGRNRYVLAFSSDHGVSTLPEQVFPAPAAGSGRGAGGGGVTGRITAANIANAAEAALDKQFGRGHYVEALATPYLYLVPGVLERIRATPSAVQAVEAAVLGVHGIAKLYWTADIAATTATTDPMLIGLRRSYYPGRTGDLAFVYERNWTGPTGANHGSPQDYDARVPLMFLGAGIAPGQHAGTGQPG